MLIPVSLASPAFQSTIKNDSGNRVVLIGKPVVKSPCCVLISSRCTARIFYSSNFLSIFFTSCRISMIIALCLAMVVSIIFLFVIERMNSAMLSYPAFVAVSCSSNLSPSDKRIVNALSFGSLITSFEKSFVKQDTLYQCICICQYTVNPPFSRFGGGMSIMGV